jgi:hypothetical protein
VNYWEARARIKTGDLIAVRARQGVFSALTRWITRSPYTHTGVAVWAGGRLLLAQENEGGCALVPLSQFAGIDFDVFACPVQGAAVELSIWDLLGHPIGYDYLDLLAIAANRLFGLPIPAIDGDGMICSALSATLYLDAGWRPVPLPSVPAPCDVVAALGQVAGPEVRP